MMSMNELTTFFGWGAVINIALITLSALMVLGMRSFVLKVHSSMFNVPEDALNLMYLKFLGYYKLANMVFFITPWIALKIMAG